MTQLVWFRNDLRIQDNPALYSAAEKGPLLAVYIENPGRPEGEHSAWWRQESLKKLNQDLKQHGGQLLYEVGDPLTVLKKLVQTHHIQDIHWTMLYELEAMERDEKIKSYFARQGVSCHDYQASLLFFPQEIQNNQGSFFKVFTPFWKKCLSEMETLLPALPAPDTMAFIPLKGGGNIPEKGEAPPQNTLWQPGEKGAWARLKTFAEEGLSLYAGKRDFPAADVTSRLSPHLRFGEVSPRQIVHFFNRIKGQPKNSQKFLSEVGWREFSYHLLFHFPDLPKKNFQSNFNPFPWRKKKDYQSDFEKWTHGNTGYPLVDAGMRELNQTGFMHNRVRMVVASFLTKNLLIPWQEGEAYFWEKLVDADPANNPASWQWVAGSGADASPYFRVFNPVLQSQKFDAEGAYIKKWVPELADLKGSSLHIPWKEKMTSYGEPIVDLSASRKRALMAYEDMKKRKA